LCIPSITRTEEEKHIFQSLKTALEKLSSDFPQQGISLIFEESTWEDEVFHGGMIAKIIVDPKLPTVALMGHLDVVPVESGWTNPSFEPIERDGKLYGRWSSDMKWGVAVMLELFRQTLTQKPNTNINFIFTTGEEFGTPNGLTLLRNMWHLEWVNFAIALEPTGGNIDIAVAGYSSIRMDFETINDTTLFIESIEAWNNTPLSEDKELISLRAKLGKSELAWKSISGGEASNTTPANAELIFTLTPGEDMSQEILVSTIQSIVSTFGGTIETCEQKNETQFSFRLIFTSKPFHNSLTKGKSRNALAKASDFWSFLNQQTSLSGGETPLRNTLSTDNQELEEALSVYKVTLSSSGKTQVYLNYRPLWVTSEQKIKEKFDDIAKGFSASAMQVLEFDTGWNPVEKNNSFLQAFIKNIGKKVNLVVAWYWTDIATTSALGIPSINFTTLDTEQAHQTDEYIYIHKLYETLNIFKKYLGLK
jgi:acetylornithine deacetylase/succinyl-diaminopimelate desuccinylase-like protein